MIDGAYFEQHKQESRTLLQSIIGIISLNTIGTYKPNECILVCMSAYECSQTYMNVQGRALPTMLIILPILLFNSSQKITYYVQFYGYNWCIYTIVHTQFYYFYEITVAVVRLQPAVLNIMLCMLQCSYL